MSNNKTKYFRSYLFLVLLITFKVGGIALTAVMLHNIRIYYKIDSIQGYNIKTI